MTLKDRGYGVSNFWASTVNNIPGITLKIVRIALHLDSHLDELVFENPIQVVFIAVLRCV